MRKRGMKLSRKTEVWLHRRRGDLTLELPKGLAPEDLTRFRMLGRGVLAEDGGLLGVGDRDSETGKYIIPLHVRGRNLMGGTEFAKIHMAAKVTGNSKPSLNENYYIAVVNVNSDGTVILDSSHIKWKENTAYTFAIDALYLTATKPKDIKLRVNYTDGTYDIPVFNTYATNIKGVLSTDPSKTISNMTSNAGDKQLIRLTLAGFGIYEGTHLSYDEIHEPYVGSKGSIVLDKPLCSIGYASDELCLITGEVKRKITSAVLDGSAEIDETDVEGTFSVPLPKKARCSSGVLTAWNGNVTVSDDGENILISRDGIEDKDAMSLYLSENPIKLHYILSEPEYETAEVDMTIPEGAYVISLGCSTAPRITYAEYI